MSNPVDKHILFALYLGKLIMVLTFELELDLKYVTILHTGLNANDLI